MKVLVVTNLFPNHLQKGRGIFNFEQFRSLKKYCELRVVAPLAYFPFKLKVQPKETIDQILVDHPQYFSLPMIGRSFYGWFYYQAIKPVVLRIQKEFDFDIILATWMYPDAYAANKLAKELNKPIVVRAHGTDVNESTKYFLRKQMIFQTAQDARAVLTNSARLKDRLVEMGVTPQKISVILNGVDSQKFYPMDRTQTKEQCGFDLKLRHILYIGNFVAIKGVRYLIEAMKGLPQDVVVHLVGDGPLKHILKKQIKNAQLTSRVIFHQRQKHAELVVWFNACDVFCLPSLNEGCPNVVLEALACNTPVVATDVGAIPQMIIHEDQGRSVPTMDSLKLSKAILEVLNQKKTKTSSVPFFSWDDNAKEVFEILKKATQ